MAGGRLSFAAMGQCLGPGSGGKADIRRLSRLFRLSVIFGDVGFGCLGKFEGKF